MTPFLEEITSYILDNHGHETGELCLVTPNRRASLFFRKHFARQVRQVMWAPDMLSIEDFINKVSGLNVLDAPSLLFRFYEVYARLEQDKARPIDDFIRWAPVLLTDMDEIDAHVEDPGQVYQALRDIKRVETWNPDGSPLTDFQRNYLAFFEHLEEWHMGLRHDLLQDRQAGQGLSSRQAATLIAGEDFYLPWKKVFFVGFNALNQCEEIIIGTLLKRGQAVFLPDGDPYYVHDPMHEAGLFIRQSCQKLGVGTPDLRDHFKEGPKRIHLLGIAKQVNQARLAGNILMQRPEISRDEHTAIVLANENLLIPVLNAIPPDTPSVNVTMGYPLAKTNIYGFFDSIWQLWLMAAKTGGHAAPGTTHHFYHHDLVRLFSHTGAGLLWDMANGGALASGLVQKMRRANSSFISFNRLCELAGDDSFRDHYSFLGKDPVSEPARLLRAMSDMVLRLDGLFREKAALAGGDIVQTSYFVDFEALYFLGSLLRRLQGFLESHPFLNDYQTAYQLFKQLGGNMRLSFAGEPLEGLQVMGMLETRSLDFKNIILLSANENILPRPKNNMSFIPFDLRKRFGLHVHSDKDAIYAYHFYRLLQRAGNVYLVYNTQTEDLGSSEKSRFLTQLQMELPAYAAHVTITEDIVALPPPEAAVPHPLSVAKTGAIIDRLKAICQSGLSPSALNAFVSCPMYFYLTRLVRIEETTEVEETIEATTLGTVVHGVLETLYRPFLGKPVGPDDYRHMHEQTGKLTRQQFETHYEGGDIDTGKNLLLFSLAKRYTDNFLREEQKRSETAQAAGQPALIILGLEERLSGTLEVPSGDDMLTVRIRGSADRIDKSSAAIRIIDYKTGKLQSNELKFSNWELIGSDSRYGKAFQLLTYAWLYARNKTPEALIEPGIISLRETKKGLQTLRTAENTSRLDATQINRFETALKNTIERILDPATPFERTTNEDNCRYCPFKVFCQRL